MIRKLELNGIFYDVDHAELSSIPAELGAAYSKLEWRHFIDCRNSSPMGQLAPLRYRTDINNVMVLQEFRQSLPVKSSVRQLTMYLRHERKAVDVICRLKKAETDAIMLKDPSVVSTISDYRKLNQPAQGINDYGGQVCRTETADDLEESYGTGRITLLHDDGQPHPVLVKIRILTPGDGMESCAAIDKDMFTIKQSAEYACVDERTIRYWLKKTDQYGNSMLPGHVKIGRKYLIPRTDLDKWRKSAKNTHKMKTPAHKRPLRKPVKLKK